MDKLKQIGSIFLFSVLIIAYFFNLHSLYELKKSLQLQSVELMQYKDSANILTTKHGELYSEFMVATVDRDNLKNALEIEGIELKELKERGIYWKNLTSLYKAKLETSTSGTTQGHDTIYVVGKDTIWGQKFNDWTDKYLTLTNIRTEQKKLFFTSTYQTDIKYAETKNKKGSIVTIWLTDPKATITTGSQINIEVSKKWYDKPWIWGVAGIASGYYLSKKL